MSGEVQLFPALQLKNSRISISAQSSFTFEYIHQDLSLQMKHISFIQVFSSTLVLPISAYSAVIQLFYHTCTVF
jgi:hypothetical protein